MEVEGKNLKRKFDTGETQQREKRQAVLKKAKELELKVSSGNNQGRKWAQTIMAMVAPMSANSNTADADVVADRVAALNAKYGKSFIIGHLINEQFPRPYGDVNFVPLTIAANSAHKSAIETKLAQFLTGMNGGSGDNYNKIFSDGLQFGIIYRVEASNDFWETDVPKLVTWTVRFGVFDSKGNEKIGVHTEDLSKLKTLASQKFKLPGIENDNGLSGTFGNQLGIIF